MRTQKLRPLTAAQREARRRNGQQSTGPRTPMGKKIVSMNAVKHGMYSSPSLESMAVLQENPLEYVKLLAGLIGSFHPRNPAETILIEDIAHLQWQRRRNEIARGARIALAVQRLELERAELRRTTENGASLDASEEELKQKGLRGIAPSPAKYRDMLSVLSILTELAKKKQFGQARHYLNLLYGEAKPEAKTRGNMIRTLFEQLELETGAAGAEAGETEGPAAASRLSERQQRLLEMLSEESEDGGEEWHNYSKQRVEITPALRGSLYAPGPEDWPLLREQALVDGLLVRKFKLLLEMQRERRRAAAEEGEVEWDLSSVKLKEPQPEGGGSSRAPDPAGGSGAQAAPTAVPGGGPQAEGCRRSEALTRKGSAVQGGPTALPEASVDQFGARPARPNHPVEPGPPRGGPKPSVHRGGAVAKTVGEKKANDKGQKQPAPSSEEAEEGVHCKIFLQEQSYGSRSKRRIGVRRLGEQSYRFHTEPSAGLCLRLPIDDSRKASSGGANPCPRIGVTVVSISHPKVSAIIRRACQEPRFVLQKHTTCRHDAHIKVCEVRLNTAT